MIFSKLFKKTLKLLIFCLFLGFSGTLLAMEISQGNIAPKASWIGIPMNGGKSASIPAHSRAPLTLWTDGLKGCVVTIIKLEYHSGDQTVAMCHFAHYSKTQNAQYLNEFINSLALNTVKKASCIIVPPGVLKERGITPILDNEWKQIIIEPLCAAIPEIAFEISPYLFNTRSSCVKYTINQTQAKGTIVNLSGEFDEKNKDILLECHNQQVEYNYKRLLAPILATAALVGFLLYHTH